MKVVFEFYLGPTDHNKIVSREMPEAPSIGHRIDAKELLTEEDDDIRYGLWFIDTIEWRFDGEPYVFCQVEPA